MRRPAANPDLPFPLCPVSHIALEKEARYEAKDSKAEVPGVPEMVHA